MSKTFSSNKINLFLFELGLFLSSLILSIVGAWRFSKVFAGVQAERGATPLSPIGLGEFLLFFAVSSAIVLGFVYFFKWRKIRGKILRVLFLLTVFIGVLFFLGLWLPPFSTLALTGFLLFLWLRRPSLWIHNLVFVLAAAGVSSNIGLRIQPEAVAFLFVVLAIYDYIAVYKTKHMVKLAKEMVDQKAILGFVVPPSSSDFLSSLKRVEPGGRFMVLGGGDVIFPAIFCVSLFWQGLWTVFVVGLFSALGLTAGFLIFISQNERRPIPALPPIAAFSLLGFLLSKIPLLLF